MHQHTYFKYNTGSLLLYNQDLLESRTLTIPATNMKEQATEMAFHNPTAEKIAREILEEETQEQLRDKVQEAVRALRNFLFGAGNGTMFSFERVSESGEHYWYGCVKSGGRWYTTASSPSFRTHSSDEALITWLIGMGVYDVTESGTFVRVTEPRVIEAAAAQST